MKTLRTSSLWASWRNGAISPAKPPASVPRESWGGVIDAATQQVLHDPGTFAKASRAGSYAVVLAANLPARIGDALATASPRVRIALLAAALRQHHSLVDRDIGVALGISRTDANLLRRLDELAPELRDAVLQEQASLLHARLLIGKPQKEQADWTRKLIKGGWSTRRLQEALKNPAGPKPGQAVDPATQQAVSQYAAALQERLSTPVKIRPMGEGRWDVGLTWFNVEQLQGLLETITQGAAPKKNGPEDRSRELKLSLTGDELDALLGHLVDM